MRITQVRAQTKRSEILSAVGLMIVEIKDMIPIIAMNTIGLYFKYSFIAPCISLSSLLFINHIGIQGCALKYYVSNLIIRNMILVQI